MQVPEITLNAGFESKIRLERPGGQAYGWQYNLFLQPGVARRRQARPERERKRYQARMVAKQDARLEAANRESQMTPEQGASRQKLADRQLGAGWQHSKPPQSREGGALEQGQKKSKLQLTEPSFTSPYKGFEAPKIPGLELKLKPPGQLPKRQEKTVQRKAEGSSPPVNDVPPVVHEVLQAPGAASGSADPGLYGSAIWLRF